MSLKGIRKALNDDEGAQAVSLLDAYNGKVPLVTIRHKEPRQAVYFQSNTGRWAGWVVSYEYDGIGKPKKPTLLYMESDKKPRAGMIMDGKPHEVRMLMDDKWFWARVKRDTPIYEQAGKWYYSGEKVIKVFSDLWGINCPRGLLTECQKTYQKRQEGKSDSN